MNMLYDVYKVSTLRVLCLLTIVVIGEYTVKNGHEYIVYYTLYVYLLNYVVVIREYEYT